jgi:hypothetical protein
MRRVANRFAVVLFVALVGVVLAPTLSLGQGGRSPLMPPQSNAFGKSFEEWNVLYSQWATESLSGGGTDLSDTVGHVSFLPGVLGNVPTTEFDVSLPPGTPFVSPPFFVNGESYDDPAVPDDNPADSILDLIFATTEIRVVLDGRVLMDGTGTELQAFQFGPVYYDEPIVYDPPQSRGPGLNATAALFVKGIGAVYQPLPPGRHTLVYTVRSAFFSDFQVTYHLTVSPR